MLFQRGDFTLHSGGKASFKIDCDALTDDDIETLAFIVSEKWYFNKVVGIPTGGLRFAKALEKYCCSEGPQVLLVDDVMTTGNSINEHREKMMAEHIYPVCVVIFLRGRCPLWVHPIFQLMY